MEKEELERRMKELVDNNKPGLIDWILYSYTPALTILAYVLSILISGCIMTIAVFTSFHSIKIGIILLVVSVISYFAIFLPIKYLKEKFILGYLVINFSFKVNGRYYSQWYIDRFLPEFSHKTSFNNREYRKHWKNSIEENKILSFKNFLKMEILDKKLYKLNEQDNEIREFQDYYGLRAKENKKGILN